MNLEFLTQSRDERNEIITEYSARIGVPAVIVEKDFWVCWMLDALFRSSLVGLDRQAAKEVMNKFLNGKEWTGNQIEFINLIVNHLTENGTMDPAMLYESPFTDVTPQGPDGIFTSAQIDKLLEILSQVRDAALAA